MERKELPGNQEYQGEEKNGKKEGFGIMLYENRNRYEGEFKDDKRNGIGITYVHNGDRYEG